MLPRLFYLLLLTASTAQAALTIEIEQGLEKTRHLVVLPFTGGVMKTNPGTVVADDFRRIGQFQVSDQFSVVTPSSSSSAETSTPTVVDIGRVEPGIPWAALNADLLVRGSVVTLDKLRVEISYELWQRDGQQPWFSEHFSIDHRRLRDASHYISDKLYEKITGHAGIFSSHIAFVATQRIKGRLHYQLQVSDIDGEQRRTLFKSDEPISSPSWSPDGRQLLYMSFESGKPAIYLQEVTRRERRLLADFSGLNGAPEMSPDGSQLSLTLSQDGNPEIYLMTLSDGRLSRITRHGAIDTEARWTSDGRSLVFTSDRGGKPQIYRVNLETLDTRRLTFEGRFNARADLSPDDRWLATVHDSGSGIYQIGVLDLQSRVYSTLTDHGMHDSPSFAPNSRLLAMVEQQGERREIRCLSLDGRADWRIHDNEADLSSPAWSPVMR